MNEYISLSKQVYHTKLFGFQTTPKRAKSGANFSTMNLSQSYNDSNILYHQDSCLNPIEEASSIKIRIQDQSRSLNDILSIFKSFNVEITRIQSKSYPNWQEKYTTTYYLDYQRGLQEQLKMILIQQLEAISQSVEQLKLPVVPWFPQQLSDLDGIENLTIQTESEAQKLELLYFKDKNYQKRRKLIGLAASQYKINDKSLPIIEYTDNDNYVWDYCFTRLSKLYKNIACEEFNWAIDQFKKQFSNFEQKVPQLNDVSIYLQSQTGWRLKPVAGMLSKREFLNGLAFKVFHCVQYVRHHSVPLYAYEPDIIHDLLGHGPMFAIQDFSDFSQQLGIASLGVSDEELEKLAAIYMYTIEFGMCREKGQLKAYGAGLMGSVNELEYCVSDKPQHLPFNPYVICRDHMNYPLNAIQPLYFVVDSFSDVTKLISDYCNQINRPFNATYNSKQQRIFLDKEVRMVKAINKVPSL
ncbi:phenylalanine 4-monooxygenase [Stylonychia lemnae]|uniref:phenylalanine 4-monooxygenase n=1 Tax=Stylonychia lemnae TaxID=5949 RepID=A0A078B6S0_STYLE|nr:phenylalanine 4-monooxygenase [Stylonychia lemnae]|eukprot:CDW89263.1 phenylalanine 4-monooxygenase [Stylonychia lemnae]